MKPLTSFVITLILVAVIGAFVIRSLGVAESGETVTIVHWTTGHLLRDGSGLRLLRQMAAEFNKDGNFTESGQRIRVEVFYLGGAEQAPELISRVTRGVRLDRELPDPALVTPSASHWLMNVNHAAGREVIDLSNTLDRSLAKAYVGIVTYREMAECLGWPAKEIGYADIIALRNDPKGWASYPCAEAGWGARPLVAFTDPSTSDTGRAVLLTLYALAANKPAEQLTAADIEKPEVVAYVKQFNRLVDHYMISTIPLNTKIIEGQRYGHFFIMPEDNLIHLYDGTERAFIDGVEQGAPPIEEDIVMIYPKEGSLLRENCACAVKAPWVSADQADGAEKWVRYLREDRQQRSFMAAGFRPGTNLPVGHPISPEYGLSAAPPRTVLNAERTNPAVAAIIDASWEDVKRPGIVTFVIDTSGSMQGEKLKQAKDGLIRALDNMAQNNRVGFISFADTVGERIEVGPLAANRFDIAAAVNRLDARGNTALYSAILSGIRMSDQAAGADDSIRAVVVLTDGKANAGQSILSDLVSMSSRRETPISECRGGEHDLHCVEAGGRQVPLDEVIGAGPAVRTTFPIQIFFVGIGDADLHVGRILSQATGAEFQGTTDKDLAKVLEVISKYF